MIFHRCFVEECFFRECDCDVFCLRAIECLNVVLEMVMVSS